MRNRSNLAYHELIGLPVRVVDPNKGCALVSGKVVLETKNTLTIVSDRGRRLIVPKRHNLFVFRLGDEDVALSGESIALRPEDRTGRMDP
jgi:RNase P/RNase MRP subunit p29